MTQTANDLRVFAHLLIANGFDLLTEYGAILPQWCTPEVLSSVLQDYNAALMRLGVADRAARQVLVEALRTKLNGAQPVPLTFRLSPNTWASILYAYTDDLAERWSSKAA